MSSPPDAFPSSLPDTPAQPLPTRSFATLRTIMALILREMSSRYGRSPGGYLWAILEPLGGIVVLGFAFALVVRTPPLGSSFLLFFSTGFLPFSLYGGIENTVARSLQFSKALLFYPAVTWVDAILARFILNSLTGLLVIYLLMTGIILTLDTRIVLDAPPIFLALALALLVGLGMGTLNCALIGKIPAWDRVWSIATRPLFLASGVFFLYEDMPKAAQDILWYNPVLHITGYMRMGFYPNYQPDYPSVAYVLFVGLVLLAFGVILIGRYHRDILND
ncbi:ABC transporter permease [Shimia biformata]|uniref:ABC transporter permease n=1 Tax=Shimia biformata TaxID=1294299 RepID=UPI001950F66C|nr:ABC transporter permease [Shimia biformata]